MLKAADAIEALQAEKNGIQGELDSLRVFADELHRRIEELQAELAGKNDAIRILKGYVEQKDKRVKELTEERDDAIAAIDALDESNDQLIKANEELKTKVKRSYFNVECNAANHDGSGCLGYSSGNDDEPIEPCKSCGEYTGNKETQ